MIKKSITVTETQEAWSQAQLSTGQYASDSEVVHEALREKQIRIAETECIRGALIAAEESGLSTLTKEDIRVLVKADISLDKID